MVAFYMWSRHPRLGCLHTSPQDIDEIRPELHLWHLNHFFFNAFDYLKVE